VTLVPILVAFETEVDEAMTIDGGDELMRARVRGIERRWVDQATSSGGRSRRHRRHMCRELWQRRHCGRKCDTPSSQQAW
jgi:hypothetical protein